MKLKAPYLYGLKDCGKGIAVGYATVLLANLVVAMLSSLVMKNIHASDFFRGMLFGMNIVNLSWIFMLVFGIVMYKQLLLLFVQNGRSRKTVLWSCVAVFVTLAVVLAFVNMLVDSFGGGKGSVYGMLMKGTDSFGFARFLWETMTLLCVSFTGMFCAAVFLRLNKFWRIALGMGIPIALLIILPSLLRLIVFGGKSMLSMALDLGLAVLGFSSLGWNPWIMSLSMMVVDVILCGGMYLVMRNTTIRK
ncbi:MAG: hypothetical protein SPD11_11520 [Sphaerochaetaceae bacterium]|nr:hypothetical protein [Sphaerochaetaceae bacterium]